MIVWIFVVIFEFIRILAMIISDVVARRIVRTMGSVQDTYQPKTSDDCRALFADKKMRPCESIRNFTSIIAPCCARSR